VFQMVRGLTVVRASVPASRGGTADGIGRCHGGEHGIAGRDRSVLGGLVGQNKFGRRFGCSSGCGRVPVSLDVDQAVIHQAMKHIVNAGV